MHPSLENRQRIALLVFFVGDHLLWYYGGHFQQVSLFYVVVSEVVRVGALLAVLASLLHAKVVEYYLKFTALYCFIMLPLVFYGSHSSKHFGKVQTPNVMWFKNEDSVPVEFGYITLIVYAIYLTCIYFTILKYLEVHLLKKSSSERVH